MRNKNGITLIEIIIVVSIIGILVVVAGFEFVGWRGRSAVEIETRDLYNNLMNARVNAMSRNRDYFLTGTNTSYTIYEDTYNATYVPSTEGDGVLQTASDRILQGFPKTVEYALCLRGGYTLPLVIGKRGLVSFFAQPSPEPVDWQFRIDPDKNCALPHDSGGMNPDYDCVNIQNETRIKMGKWNVATSVCDIK